MSPPRLPLFALCLAVGCGPSAVEEPGPALDAGTPLDGGAIDAGTAAPSFAKLDAWLTGHVDAGTLHGFAMLVFNDADELLYQGQAGQCALPGVCPSGAPAFTIDTVTGVASSSKWVTSTVVLAALEQAVAQGKLESVARGLDTPISAVLPCAASAGRSGQVTLRQLLSFTDGLIPSHDCVSDRSDTLQNCACSVLTASHAAEVERATDGTPQRHAQPPGTVFKYGETHHAVAGAAIERLTGTPFQTLYQQLVATPAGMQGRYNNPNNLAGSMRTSVADFARFVRAVYHDGQGGLPRVLLAPESVAEQEASQMPPGVLPLLTPQPGLEYGLNVWRWCSKPIDFGDLTQFDPSSIVADPSCTAIHQSGHGGKGGYQPFIDRQRHLYGVFAMREESAGDDATYSLKELAITEVARLYAAAVAGK